VRERFASGPRFLTHYTVRRSEPALKRAVPHRKMVLLIETGEIQQNVAPGSAVVPLRRTKMPAAREGGLKL
jgi:hypothetical protein